MACLEDKPKQGSGFEEDAQSERAIHGYRALAVDYIIHTAQSHSRGARQSIFRDFQAQQKFPVQDKAGMGSMRPETFSKVANPNMPASRFAGNPDLATVFLQWSHFLNVNIAAQYYCGPEAF